MCVSWYKRYLLIGDQKFPVIPIYPLANKIAIKDGDIVWFNMV